MTYTKTYTMTYTKIVAPFNQQASMTCIAQSFCRPTIIACTTILCVHLMIWTIVHICLGDWSSIIVVIIVQQSVGKEQCEAGGDTWFNFRSGTTTTALLWHHHGTTRALLTQARKCHTFPLSRHRHQLNHIYCFHQKIVLAKVSFLDVVEGRFRCWSRLAVRAESDRFSQSLT